MTAYLAHSLVALRNEINAAFPHRDKSSDGWIGDAAHSARISDHNPDPHSSPPECVDAIDVDVDDGDPTKDLRTRLIARAIAHPSTHYIISNGKIYSREYGFRARVYTGTNGHYHHVHVSILKTEAARDSMHVWGIAGGSAPATTHTVAPYHYTHLPLRQGDHNPDVGHAQTRLQHFGFYAGRIDSDFGPATFTAVEALQRHRGLHVDGVIGPETAGSLG